MQEFRRLDTQVLGVSTDAAAAQGAFAKQCELEFSLVSDFPKFEAAKAFGVLNEDTLADRRVTFVIDKESVIRHVIDDAQNMERHAEESLKVIAEFGA